MKWESGLDFRRTLGIMEMSGRTSQHRQSRYTPVAKSAAQAIANHKQGMAGAGQRYAAGIQSVTENPCAKAAAAVASGYWAQRTTAAAPKMAAKLNSVAMDAWKSAASTFGVSAYTAAAGKASANYAKVAQKVVDAGQAGRAAAQALPASDAMGRMAANMSAIKAAWGQS